MRRLFFLATMLFIFSATTVVAQELRPNSELTLKQGEVKLYLKIGESRLISPSTLSQPDAWVLAYQKVPKIQEMISRKFWGPAQMISYAIQSPSSESPTIQEQLVVVSESHPGYARAGAFPPPAKVTTGTFFDVFALGGELPKGYRQTLRQLLSVNGTNVLLMEITYVPGEGRITLTRLALTKDSVAEFGKIAEVARNKNAALISSAR